MLMEAMRLSMLDHEEQQRKTAEEKRKREAVEPAAAGEESSTSPAASPSSNCAVSLQFNSPAPDGRAPASNTSSLPVSYRRGLTQHTGSKSRSVSRSSTPPPTNPGFPLSSGNQAEWGSRKDGPGQCSMLPATLTTTSAAAATLPNGSPAGLLSDVDDPSSVPTITIALENTERSASNHPTDADGNSIYSDSPLPPLPVEASTLSSTSADEPSTSGSTSTSSSFGSLENNTQMSAHIGSGNLGSSLLNSGVQGLGKSAVLETSTVHIEDVAR